MNLLHHEVYSERESTMAVPQNNKHHRQEYKDLWRHSSVRSGIGKSVLTGMEGKEFVSLKKAQLRIS